MKIIINIVDICYFSWLIFLKDSSIIINIYLKYLPEISIYFSMNMYLWWKHNSGDAFWQLQRKRRLISRICMWSATTYTRSGAWKCMQHVCAYEWCKHGSLLKSVCGGYEHIYRDVFLLWAYLSWLFFTCTIEIRLARASILRFSSDSRQVAMKSAEVRGRARPFVGGRSKSSANFSGLSTY